MHPDLDPDADLDRLRHVIDHAAHVLPAQGPITVFIHHNILHAFEDLPFEQAVVEGGRIFGCQPFLTEERYRAELGRGRIRFDELRTELDEDLGGRAGEPVAGLAARRDLRLGMLQYPLPTAPVGELLWYVAETDALRKARPDVSAAVRGRLVAETRRWVLRGLRGGAEAARNGHRPAGRPAPDWLRAVLDRFQDAAAIELWDDETWEAFTLHAVWRICLAGVRGVPEAAPPPPPRARHRDLLLRAPGVDTDPWVNDVLIRFTAAFLDQGVAHWQLPHRDEGYFRAFLALYREPHGPPDRWMVGLAAVAGKLADARVGPLESVRDSLAALGVPAGEWDEFVAGTLLSLRGWGGMIRQVEERTDRVAHPVPEGSLVEFLAVRLLLERLALGYAAREELGYRGPPAGLRAELRARVPDPAPPTAEQRAFVVFQLAQVMGWTPEELSRLTPAGWASLVGEVEAFNPVERRRVFHLAYERRFRTQTLDALALHPRFRPAWGDRPRFQTITCLDEREESFRRHLEEIAPDCETFGAAGFFAVPMYYRGAADAHFVPLCPIVMVPRHWVAEQVEGGQEAVHRFRARARRALGASARQFHVGTRSLALGAVLTAGVGALAAVPLLARILFPRLTARVRGALGGFVEPPPKTRLKLERQAPDPGPEDGHLGFDLGEMVGSAERLLRDVGLTRGFARVVFVIGHGSNSLNNPHKSAYDCGACGGSPGAPNGRALAFLMNDPRVRAGLAARGLPVPADTVFVGGFHNTCDDSVTLFDTDRVPETHRAEFDRARREIDLACERNAHERCRRFMSAPLTMSFAEAKRHVEGRAEDLAQTRPELGHATNAVCHVGRRERTRGLYLDRRAFLTAYDPTQDTPAGDVLARTMAAVFPVCGGINLEYYFSHVDSPGYGCGTKLPHNIASLLGVMDGAQSDLRTGLPWQMTEIHEPVRLLIVCETTPEVMTRVLEGNPLGMTMTKNGWVQLALQSPETNEILVYKDGAFVPYVPQATQLPRAASSTDWYRGWRDHLEFAEIGA